MERAERGSSGWRVNLVWTTPVGADDAFPELASLRESGRSPSPRRGIGQRRDKIGVREYDGEVHRLIRMRMMRNDRIPLVSADRRPVRSLKKIGSERRSPIAASSKTVSAVRIQPRWTKPLHGGPTAGRLWRSN